MIHQLLRRLFQPRCIHAVKGYWDQNVDDLGYFAEVSGPFWMVHKKLLLREGFALVGRLNYGCDLVAIARYKDTQLFAKFLFKLYDLQGECYRIFWKYGLLDTAEGERIRFWHDLRFTIPHRRY